MLQKALIIKKNSTNGSCVELNFLQKTHWKHISLSSPGVEVWGSKDLALLFYQEFYLKTN